MQVKIEIVGFNVDCRVHSLLKKIINEAFQSHQIHNIHMTKFTEASKNIMPTGIVFKAKLLFVRTLNPHLCTSIFNVCMQEDTFVGVSEGSIK